MVFIASYSLSDSHGNVDKLTNECKLAFLLLLFSHLNFEDKGCHDPCTDTERFCCPCHIMFTKPTWTNNKVIHTRDRYTSVKPANLR